MATPPEHSTSTPSAPSPPGGSAPVSAIPPQFVPVEHEGRIRDAWEAAKAFHADPARVLRGEAEPYCILIPPPNVTAALHLGHALNNTLQDILARNARMRGFETLWMPGTDHAGIATQAVVEKRVQKDENKRRKDFTREEFVAKIQAFKDEYEAVITNQLKMMGCSCDWDRQRFTMDPQCARAVYEAFFRLFKDGLIYRGKRLVNWDPALQTAVADDECYDEEIDGAFYYLRYPLVHASSQDAAINTGGRDNVDPVPVTWGELARRGYPGASEHGTETEAWVTVATTRPETYLGDTAVGINPHDPRARALRGLYVELPLVGRIIPIIEDAYVVLPKAIAEQLGRDEEAKDPKAGMATGFLKVTPAHDPNDYELGQRHNLAKVNMMSPDGRVSNQHGWDGGGDTGAEIPHSLLGKKMLEARKHVVEEFKTRGLLEATKPHRHSVKHSDRSKAIIEPYLSDQWYVKVTDPSMAQAANEVLSRGTAGTVGRASPPASGETTTSTRQPLPPLTVLDSVKHNWERGTGKAVRTYIRRLPHMEKAGSTYFITFRLKQGELSAAERQIVLDACYYWNAKRAYVYAVTVMPDHVHLLLRPMARDDGTCYTLGEILHSIKSFTAHEINKQREASGTLWQDEWFDRIVRDDAEYDEKCEYIAQNAVRKGLASAPKLYPYFRETHSHLGQNEAGGDARPTDESNTLTFHPPRYAKTYEQWHDNIRDWCISRQLWWGHRIPVWSRTGLTDHEADDACEDLRFALSGIVEPLGGTPPQYKTHPLRGNFHWVKSPEGNGKFSVHACLVGMDEWAYGEVVENVIEKSNRFTRDPDVLDTWFSSALWPLSTMGWPDDTALLKAFNPTTTLCTAREIITLWVSRMVMFNRYFLPENWPSLGTRHSALITEQGKGRGPVPFRDVVVHAVIQDGEGRKMSKSLGNGIDPLEIIETHGSDAMRFTLTHMTTDTQDVRLPVEKDSKTGKNTSKKFDLGRQIVNKLWNATTGVALRNMPAPGTPASTTPVDAKTLSTADRWLLSRLEATVRAVDKAIASYDYSNYAIALYDFIYRDLCDWYLEAVKPTLKNDPQQQAVLARVIDTVLRIAHPAMPYITEALWPHVRNLPVAPIPGITLGGSRKGDVLATAGWPFVAPSLSDPAAEAEFDRLRAFVTAVREVRAQHQVPPKRRITAYVPAKLHAELAAGTPADALSWVYNIAGIGTIKADNSSVPTGTPAVTIRVLDHEITLTDLADAVDASTENDRKAKLISERTKEIDILKARLNNPGYVERAPAKLIEETKSKLKKLQDELDSLR